MMWPCLTRYTDNLPEDVGGNARGPLVCVRPKYRDDQGIHAHEYEHVRQWWTAGLIGAALIVVFALAIHMPQVASLAALGFLSHPLSYAHWSRYRQWCEATAYREQMLYPDRHGGYLSLDAAAERLALPMYRLGLTPDQARNILLRL